MKARKVKLGSTLALALMGSCSFLATAADHGYKMVIIDEAPGVEALQSGHFAEGIQTTLDTPAWEIDKFTRNMNLCVGFTKLGEFKQAETACTNAINSAKFQQAPQALKREMRAYAYTNRGVSRSLSDDRNGALEDFKRSAELNGSTVTLHNLAILETAYRSNSSGAEVASLNSAE